jgi:hypothetical protein
MRPLKNIIKKTPLYPKLLAWRQKNSDKKALKNWEFSGRPLPPPQLYKQLLIKELALLNNIETFVETGTYYGDTLNLCKNIFRQLFSIELDKSLFELANKRFKNDKKITLLQGDSGEEIEKILKKLSGRCLFWLDGHYSEGVTAKGVLNTPIMMELTHILNHTAKNHIILIDDARCFTGEDDYPTIAYLKDFVAERNPNLNFSVADDIIRIY